MSDSLSSTPPFFLRAFSNPIYLHWATKKDNYWPLIPLVRERVATFESWRKGSSWYWVRSRFELSRVIWSGLSLQGLNDLSQRLWNHSIHTPPLSFSHPSYTPFATLTSILSTVSIYCDLSAHIGNILRCLLLYTSKSFTASQHIPILYTSQLHSRHSQTPESVHALFALYCPQCLPKHDINVSNTAPLDPRPSQYLCRHSQAETKRTLLFKAKLALLSLHSLAYAYCPIFSFTLRPLGAGSLSRHCRYH